MSYKYKVELDNVKKSATVLIARNLAVRLKLEAAFPITVRNVDLNTVSDKLFDIELEKEYNLEQTDISTIMKVVSEFENEVKQKKVEIEKDIIAINSIIDYLIDSGYNIDVWRVEDEDC